MSTIPANTVVQVTPSVLSAGGTGINGTGLALTRNTRVPIGTVQAFASTLAVSNYFGASDPLATTLAPNYFGGFVGSSITPATLLMAQCPAAAVAAYLRGGNISGLTLAQLQAITGTLTVVMDGFTHAGGTINISGATSFSNAASLIQTALNGSLGTLASVTASIAAVTSTYTGSIAGNVLTITTPPSNPIVNGSTITGTGVTANTVITNQLTGTIGGIGTYAVNISQIVASTSMTTTYGLMTVTAAGTPGLAVGQTLTGTGVTAGTIITQLGTGTGGNGTYYVNLTQTTASTTITATATALTVTFDSVSGAFIVTSGITGVASTAAFATGTAAASLLLTSATGAVLSQGANAQTPSAFMNALTVLNSAWANFMTHFDPDGGSGNAQKQLFAAWKMAPSGFTANRFGYFCWDPDTSPAASAPAASSLGQILKGNNDSGTLLVWEGGGALTTADTGLCAFALGIAASINFQATNGRADFDFRQSGTITANVTDPTTSGNLTANGYCFYGAIGSGNQQFVYFQNGQITGPFAWADSFEVNIWLNTFFQQQLLNMLNVSLSVPFTTAGIALIQQTCQTVIQAALAFGAFAPNTLTASQIAQVNSQAGANVAGTLQTQGFYLQILLPPQTIQAARGPWSITFWYIDRNSVHSINLSSVMVP